MMPEALGGCVGPGLRVYGIQKLSIVDASILPMILSYSPGLDFGPYPEEQPLYINAKQFHQILKRRIARQKFQESLLANLGETNSHSVD
jgi:hypothetical protein